METIIPYFSGVLRDATSGELRGAAITILLILIYKYIYVPWSKNFENIESDLQSIKYETEKLMRYSKSTDMIYHDVSKVHDMVEQILNNSDVVHDIVLKNEKQYEYISRELAAIKNELQNMSNTDIKNRLVDAEYRIKMESRVEKIIERLDPVLTALKGIK